MKKQLSLLLSIVAIFSLISCNESQEQQSSKKESIVGTTSEVVSITSVNTSSINNTSSSNIQQSDSQSSSISSSSEQNETYYHVIFVNYDNSILYETDVLEGSAATYSGEEPTKEEEGDFTYKFIGWDVDLSNIISDVTAVAQFEAVAKENWGPIIW